MRRRRSAKGLHDSAVVERNEAVSETTRSKEEMELELEAWCRRSDKRGSNDGRVTMAG